MRDLEQIVSVPSGRGAVSYNRSSVNGANRSYRLRGMKTKIIATILLAAVWAPLPARADQAAAAETREQTIAQELKAVEDPTLLKRRSWLETEWNRFRDGSSGIEETLGGLWSWRVSSTQDWAVRLKLPVRLACRRPYGR